MYFTLDNTDGYDEQALAELNRMFEAKIQDAYLPEDATELEVGAIEDAVAERVLAEFDVCDPRTADYGD